MQIFLRGSKRNRNACWVEIALLKSFMLIILNCQTASASSFSIEIPATVAPQKPDWKNWMRIRKVFI